MTRLFLRFYFGVIVILFAAWLIQAYVFRRATAENNISVIEDALSGGALLVRDEIVAGGEALYPETIARVRSRFAYPVNVVEQSARPLSEEMQTRLKQGAAVYHFGMISAAIPESKYLVELGPLPAFSGPTQTDLLLGLGSVLMLCAVSIAVLLRPFARQLRNIERAALAIAAGDLSARIDGGKRKVGLPIAGAFNTMAERVETLLRSQKELLQAVSHELRTPLARIKFATELVRSADSDVNREQRLASIDHATDQLDALVGELLDYTRMDAGAEAADREDVLFDELIAESIDLYAPLFPEIKFQIDESSLPLSLHTYRAGLLRAIGNLVSNAGKYAKTKVDISASQQANRIFITVDDDGNGITPENRETVFEPFKRLSSDARPGTGLGLALVRRIIRSLGGDVTVCESSLGGARLQITLPSSEQAIR